MFKNLIRLRILDFFELTAAAGGALYVYQYGGWYDFEKLWIGAAVSIAALVIWIATRIGKTAPTPGLFLAAYTGALYGLSDLSPWMVVFGRLPVLQVVMQQFPSTFMEKPALSELARLSLALAILMIVPATLFACAWNAAFKVSQKFWTSNQPAASVAVRTFQWLQVAMALTFVSTAIVHLVTPKVRYSHTIRIPKGSNVQATVVFRSAKERPFAEQKATDDALFRSPIEPPAEYNDTSLCAWTISPSGDAISYLTFDRKLRTYDIRTGKLLAQASIAPGSESENALVYSERRPAGSKPIESLEDPALRHYQNYELWWLDGCRLLLCLELRGPKDAEYFELIDLAHECQTERILESQLKAELIEAISSNGQFVVMKETAKGRSNQFTVCKIDSLDKTLRKIAFNPTEEHRLLLISSQGDRVEASPSQFFPICGMRLLNRYQEIIGESLHGPRPTISNDGNWILNYATLHRAGDDENLLVGYEDIRLNFLLQESTGRVVLMPTPPFGFTKFADYGALPVLENLLERAHLNQISLFDPRTKRTSLSPLPANIFNRPNFGSIKFTPDGRYLIVQDEDDTADLFHVFSIP